MGLVEGSLPTQNQRTKEELAWDLIPSRRGEGRSMGRPEPKFVLIEDWE